MKLIIFFVLFALYSNVLSQQASWARLVLKQHNDRRLAMGLGALKWNNVLAKVGENYLKKCTKEGARHNANRAAQYKSLGGRCTGWKQCTVGENWAGISAGSDKWDTDGAVRRWADEEVKNWSCGQNKCLKGMCGHLTQILWADTTEVGCAKNDACGDMVCNYRQAGNFGGERPFPSSKCGTLNRVFPNGVFNGGSSPRPAPVRPRPAPVRPRPAPVRPRPAPVRPRPQPVRPRPVSKVCTRHSQCGSRKYCKRSGSRKICVNKKSNFQLCTSGINCLSGFCTRRSSKDSRKVCKPRRSSATVADQSAELAQTGQQNVQNGGVVVTTSSSEHDSMAVAALTLGVVAFALVLIAAVMVSRS